MLGLGEQLAHQGRVASNGEACRGERGRTRKWGQGARLVDGVLTDDASPCGSLALH